MRGMKKMGSVKSVKKSMRILPTKLMTKKGVSPLVATVLLIAFSVALGALVMNWGTDYVKDVTEEVTVKSSAKTTCSIDVSIDIRKIPGRNKASYNPDTGSLEFLIENKGVDLEDLHLAVIAEDVQIIPSLLGEQTFPQAEVRNIKATYNTSIGEPVQLVVTPAIRLSNGEIALCSQSSLPINDLTKVT